ncbi:MAG: GNAT family N-acetyltransferase [Burkholderiales bacterium]|nr:GNAT family N-acetyltransferase [Burkholderiales bacterium]
MNYELLPVRFDTEAISAYVRLFGECFPGTNKFNRQYVEWLYQQNPYGPAVGFDAWLGDRLASHYVGIPIAAQVDGTPARALLSLNTATHPEHQGRGLFTKLAERTYDTAAEQGLDLVFGVANANSTPGFTRKLGFQLVEPLAAKVGLGSLGIDCAEVEKRAQFRTSWTPSGLAWRCANPNNRISHRVRGDRLQLYAPAISPALQAYAELGARGLAAPSAADRRTLSPLRLYIGLEPTGLRPARAYVDIPQRLRPSPLNLIYRPLSTIRERLDAGSVSFSFLDFDAY